VSQDSTARKLVTASMALFVPRGMLVLAVRRMQCRVIVLPVNSARNLRPSYLARHATGVHTVLERRQQMRHASAILVSIALMAFPILRD